MFCIYSDPSTHCLPHPMDNDVRVSSSVGSKRHNKAKDWMKNTRAPNVLITVGGSSHERLVKDRVYPTSWQLMIITGAYRCTNCQRYMTSSTISLREGFLGNQIAPCLGNHPVLEPPSSAWKARTLTTTPSAKWNIDFQGIAWMR